MRKLLKRLRKGIRVTCMSAVLATCWQVGQPAEVSAAVVDVNFSGTLSLAVNNLSHLYLIYGTGYSSVILNYGAVRLGEFSSGQSAFFSVLDTVERNSDLFWFVAGLYGDVSGGYVEGLNGVTLGIDASEGES